MAKKQPLKQGWVTLGLEFSTADRYREVSVERERGDGSWSLLSTDLRFRPDIDKAQDLWNLPQERTRFRVAPEVYFAEAEIHRPGSRCGTTACFGIALNDEGGRTTNGSPENIDIVDVFLKEDAFRAMENEANNRGCLSAHNGPLRLDLELPKAVFAVVEGAIEYPRQKVVLRLDVFCWHLNIGDETVIYFDTAETNSFDLVSIYCCPLESPNTLSGWIQRVFRPS